MDIKLSSYFIKKPHTFSTVANQPLGNNAFLYHLNSTNGKVTIREVVEYRDGIIKISNTSGEYTNDGCAFSRSNRVLFPLTQEMYDALVTLYGIDNVAALPTCKPHSAYIINMLNNGKMLLCVVSTEMIGTYVYGVTLIAGYSHDTGMYHGFDGKMYDDAVPIDTYGNIIYVIDDGGV